MKTKLLFIMLLLLPVVAIAQTPGRKILHGKVIADSLKVENLTVLNMTSNISAVTDNQGEFTIYAKPADTLLFTGIAVVDARLVLRMEHFMDTKLVIQLNVDVRTLDEVVISANALTGQLDSDSRTTKTKNITGGMDSGGLIATDPEIRTNINPNSSLPSAVVGSQLTGVNFTEVYKLLFKKRKRKDAGKIYGAPSGKTFSEDVKERFTYHFFTQMLKIPKDEIGLFIAYCDKGKETAWMLDPKKEFELTDYLVSQSSEYLKKGK